MLLYLFSLRIVLQCGIVSRVRYNSWTILNKMANLAGHFMVFVAKLWVRACSQLPGGSSTPSICWQIHFNPKNNRKLLPPTWGLLELHVMLWGYSCCSRGRWLPAKLFRCVHTVADFLWQLHCCNVDKPSMGCGSPTRSWQLPHPSFKDVLSTKTSSGQSNFIPFHLQPPQYGLHATGSLKHVAELINWSRTEAKMNK